ncbi:hypothetical protein SOPP22_05815 [Shewanella sp. OPT22]|nr:hypothetical protein SOPP22_05815 [Shewanella sp. OPT22]
MDRVSHGAGSPDVHFYYTSSQLYAWMSDYSDAGRLEYIKTRFSYDLFWPIIYVSFLSLAISFSHKFQLSCNVLLKSYRAYFNLLPIAAGSFDLLENITVSVNMYFYPEHLWGLDWISGFCTLFKWIFVALAFGVFFRESFGSLIIWFKLKRS